MNYMVLECHPGYAVVLDEEGHFLKVANRQYEVGQMVTDVVQMQVPPKKKAKKWIYSLAAMAACLALILTLVIPGFQQPYASVYIKINPEVRLDVNRQDIVVGLSGVNQDGIDLIQGYVFQGKHLDLVADELVDKAIADGYLQPEGQITLSLDSSDLTWVENHRQSLTSELQIHLQDKIVVTICIEDHEDHHEDDDDDDEDDDDDHDDHDDHDDDEDDHAGIYPDPDDPNRIEIQPEWEDDDDDRDDHDDHDDDHDDHDDDDDDEDHDDRDDHDDDDDEDD